MSSKLKIFSAISSLIFSSLLNLSCSNTTANKIEATRGYIDERNKPVVPYNGPMRSGAQVYASYCATCHDRTTQGAPLPDDDVEWSIRLKKGRDVLLKHVMEGYRELMPVNGGCRNCTEEEVQAAIDYILITSGVEDVK